jgi:hypothetical protein
MSPLGAIKVAHTLVWVFFATCIFAIFPAAWLGEFRKAVLLIAVVAVEVVIILANRWRCPLTDVAARYTDDRRENFDIYLPRWLARHNKTIFGIIYAAGVILTYVRWRGWVG